MRGDVLKNGNAVRRHSAKKCGPVLKADGAPRLDAVPPPGGFYCSIDIRNNLAIDAVKAQANSEHPLARHVHFLSCKISVRKSSSNFATL
jgi:hypothetical protein